MKSLQFIDRRVGYLLTAFAMLLAAISPALIVPQVSAAQLTARSIQMSTSKVSATGVIYTVKFTTTSAAGAAIIDFCSQSPLVGSSTCSVPTGLSTASVGTSDASTTVTSKTWDTSEVRGVKIVKAAMSTPGVQTINITGMVNPSTAGSFYARILTYADSSDADGYTDSGVVGSSIDDGGVALSATNSIGVTAAVLESMTFCVASATITANCANANSNLPDIELGEVTGGVKALSTSAVSTGTIYTQISTNAASGAVVNLKSSATSCGGLIRVGGSNCISASSDGISQGEAEFGVKTSTAYGTASGATPSGTLQPVSASGYNDTTYFLDYPGNNTTGVTSPYGDPFLDTNSLPANNQNMDLTFGASISASTAAGTYAADLNLIATGTF